MYAEDPAFVAAEGFGKACRLLAERSQDVELVDMRLEVRGEVRELFGHMDSAALASVMYLCIKIEIAGALMSLDSIESNYHLSQRNSLYSC